MRTLLTLLTLCAAGVATAAECCDPPAAGSATAAAAACTAVDLPLADLKKAIADKKVLLIDANGPESYAKGHLPGAVDFAANAKDLAKVLPADKAALVVAYCGGPKCGAWQEAAKAVCKLGYTNVKHFSGGLSGWKEAGEAFEVATK